MTREARSIAIIGSGLSGTLLAVHLLRLAAGRDRIYLFEKAPPFGRGTAYSTESDSHLLNARAGDMSAFEEAPLDFVDWLNSVASGDIGALKRPVLEDAFVPRQRYGRYLQHHLREANPARRDGQHLFPVSDEVVDITESGHGVVVRSRDGRQVHVDGAVVSIGNLPPDQDAPPYYAGNPWSPDATSGIDPAADLLIIGTGLTMVDTVLSLADRDHSGRIHAVSRHGLLPRAHAADRELPPWPLTLPLPVSCLGLLRAVRAEVARAALLGRPWQDVVQALRPQIQALWQRLPFAERDRFLRHLRPWWEVRRHCIPPRAAARINQLASSGQLRIVAGRLEELFPGRGSASVRIRRRGTAITETLRVTRVINCSGPNTDLEASEHVLVRHLLARGDVRTDVHRLGLDVDRRGAVVNRYGYSSRRLYALGPITRGTFWEISAAPEIRQQSAALAQRLLGRPTLSTGLEFNGLAGEAGRLSRPQPDQHLER